MTHPLFFGMLGMNLVCNLAEKILVWDYNLAEKILVWDYNFTEKILVI